MDTHTKIKTGIVLFCVCLLPAVQARAAEMPQEEWVDVNVLVNLVDANDANSVEAVIKKANTILEQSKIRLILKKVNKDFKTGNGDANLTDNEGTNALEEGKKELAKVFGAGKGIKITITEDVWTEEPNTDGWSVHRNPVLFAETYEDPNTMGNVTAHEFGHVFTLQHRENDANNLMYPYTNSSRTVLDVNQTDEIFMEIKKRGTTYLRQPQPLPSGPELGSAGVTYPVNGFGAVFDGLGDVLVTDLLTGTAEESNDPTLRFADLDELLIGIDEPFNPGGIVKTQILLGDIIPHEQVEFFADLSFYLYEVGKDPEYPPDATATMHRSREGVWEAEIYDPNFHAWPLEPPRAFENERFDTGLPEELVNQTLELDIPIVSLNTALNGRFNLNGPPYLLVHGNTWVADYRNNDATPVILQDTTEFTYILPEGQPPGPQINFTHDGIFGHGFTPVSDVGIWLNNNLIDTTRTIDDGTFFYMHTADAFANEPFTRTGTNSVIAKELDDNGPNGAPHAIGFFEINNVDVGN